MVDPSPSNQLMAVIAQADVLRYLSTRGAFAGKSVLAPLRFHQHGYGYLLRPDMPDDEVRKGGGGGLFVCLCNELGSDV
jgi:hypothetical protein